MQRRATALWAAFFIVLAVGSYAMIGVAQEPEISVDDPDHTLSNGSTVAIAGTEYDVAVEGGAPTLTYFNESARATATLENGTDVEFENDTYTLLIPNASDPGTFTLREQQPLPENATTVTVNGTEYVVLQRNGSRTLVPTDEYLRDLFGPVRTVEFSESDRFPYRGNETTVDVTADAVHLSWAAPQEESIELADGERVEFGGTEYVVHVRSDTTAVLTSDIEAYEQQVAAQETYRERINGLWAVSIIGVLSTLTLIGLAYMPSRY